MESRNERRRVQDELVGQMAELLDVDYDTLSLEIDDSETRHRVLTSEPMPQTPAMPVPSVLASSVGAPQISPATVPKIDQDHDGDEQTPPSPPSQPAQSEPDGGRLQGHIVSPAPTTERLQSIQRLVAEQMGDSLPDFETDVLRAIPVQVGGLYPISDVWYIEPGLDAPDRLRTHIAQFASEIADEAGMADCIEPCRPWHRLHLPAFGAWPNTIDLCACGDDLAACTHCRSIHRPDR